jgi:hypothetical protein
VSKSVVIANNLLTASCSWRCVKEDFLHHFSLPRLDLLAWVLVTKLAPTYYRKLEVMLTDIGRFRELPKWRKDFKAEWMKAMRTEITMPLNEKYCPDTQRLYAPARGLSSVDSCCASTLSSSFSQSILEFFLKVTRNRSLPFWSHPSLKPLTTAMDAKEPRLRPSSSSKG